MKIKRKTLIYVMVMMLGLTGLTARAAMETEKTFLVTAPPSGKGAGNHETLPEGRWPDSGIADVWASSEPGGADTWEQEAADGGFSPYPEPPSGSDPWTLSVPDPGMEGEADMELAGGPDTGYPAPSVMENEVLTTQTESDAAPLDEMPVLAGPVELNPALPGLIEDTQYGGSSGDEEEKPAIEIETQAQEETGKTEEMEGMEETKETEETNNTEETEGTKKTEETEGTKESFEVQGEDAAAEDSFQKETGFGLPVFEEASEETEGNAASKEILQKENGTKEKTGEETEQESESEKTYRYEDSMSLEDLLLLPREEAGSATEMEDIGKKGPVKGLMSLRAAPSGSGLWNCSDYYVNEQDLHSVSRSADFSLKYQIEFHTSTDLDALSVEIRIPQELLKDRSGESVLPSQIGVPRGTEQSPCESLNSPFNWYSDDADQNLVFFNYRAIEAGTNTAFQVLYHPVRILELTDGSQWSLTPSIRVALQNGTVQTALMEELKGSIDSHAQISAASASAFSDGSVSCMPALYTPDQVSRVLGGRIPDDLSSQEGEWLFIAWQIDCQGEYNQPWSMQMDADLSVSMAAGPDDSRVVGSVTRITGTSEGSGGKGNIINRTVAAEGSSVFARLSSEDLKPYHEQGLFHLTTTVVSAVRKDCLRNNETVPGLTASIVLTPGDGIDAASRAQASASWTFVEYQWKYKGDDVGIFAWTGETRADGQVSFNSKNVTMSGWINEYRLSMSSLSPAGSIPVRIRSECRGYSFTHETGGPEAGSYRAGSGYEVTTVDDAAYLACLSAASGSGMQLLSSRDYFYSGISVSITDRGMDIFEDRVCAPMTDAECLGADRSTEIFVMYEDSSSWELAARCPWVSSGKITYVFPKNQLDRKIWRVKVVHCAADYDSSCTIDAMLCIRPDSPVCAQLLGSAGEDSLAVLKAEHLGSVLARSTGGSEQVWFHDSGAGHYDDSEPGIRELTMSLYGMYSMRANSFAELTSMKKHAKALKKVSRENDPAGGCIRLTCTIGALEGYRIYSREAAERIARQQTGFPAPDRCDYVICDLLPEGVVYDPTVPVKAGLIMEESDKSLVTSSLWNCRDVSVRIDPDSGVLENWKNTGRTMVVLQVTIRLEPEMVPRMSGGMWMNGVGVEFGASCSYRDLKLMKKMPNIAAVMPGSGKDDPDRQILGTDQEVSCDDGNIVPFTGKEREELQVFGADIDSDGVTNLRTVLYAIAGSEADTAVSLTDGIHLTVRDDRDLFSDWDVSAQTGPGNSYTYRIDVTNTSSQPIYDLVIADHLERAEEERALAESGRVFDAQTWRGFLESVDTGAVRRAGIEPVVWLSTNRSAPLPGEGNPPDSVFTESNGWILLEEWTGEMSDVCSVAVDLRHRADGSSFQLGMGESVHIFLHMNAPEIGDDEGQTRAEHAYNCASFYSTSQDEPDGDLVQGDAVEVTLKENAVLIVEKEVENEPAAPGGKLSFLFRLTRDGKAYPLCAYRLEERSAAGGETVWTEDGSLHTTGRDGSFSLAPGQRAVFENEAGGDSMEAEEIRSACWEVRMLEENTEEGRVLRFENTWYPTLYLTKKVLGAPEQTDLSGSAFRVFVRADGESMAGMPYWTVDPEGGSVEDQVLEEHTVDEDSCVLLHPGEVIALHPGGAECVWSAVEDSACCGEGTDFAPVTVEKSGILGQEGSRFTLENAWRWKELVLRKEVLHRENSLCGEEFTFRLWRMHDGADASFFDPEYPASEADPVPGIGGRMEDVHFTTDENGCFSLACAGKEVVLSHLEALGTYVVQEIDVPPFYEPVNGGAACVLMPLLGSRKAVTIQNSWRKRSLKVSKAVLSGASGARTTVFSPGYPGTVRSEGSSTELYAFASEDMTGFSISFPVKLTLSGNERIRVRSGSTDIDSFSGTIEAGTTRTYSGFSDVSILLWGIREKNRSGFFFCFSPVMENTDAGEDVTGKTFSFLLEKEDENGTLCPSPDTPYLTSDGEELSTGGDGTFTLTAGMSATFRDLAPDGCAWRVTESPDPSCPQAYPSGGAPQSGRLGERGEDTSNALFINGRECQGMLRKQYTAAPGDVEAGRYLDAERAKGPASSLRTLFYIETENGNGVYTPLTGEVCVADASEGTLLRCGMYNGWICLSENQTLVLGGLPEGGSWRATETADSVFSGDGYIYGTVCTSPGEGRQITGRVSDGIQDAVFVNEIHSADISPDSLVRKDFLPGSGGWNQVPEGAVLAFCLERYENGSWSPASGICWAQCLNGKPVGSGMNRTGADGIIRVKREADTEAFPVFPIAISGGSVKTELYYMENEAQEGDLRIREARDLSDPSFGMLAECDGNIFLNCNDMQALVVEKQTDIESSQSFPMKIRQWFGDLSLPGKFLPYKIRDPETLEVTGSAVTDAQGAFSLRGGVQAVFELPEGTKWEVTENSSGNWTLSSCVMDHVFTDSERTDRGMVFELNHIRRNTTLTAQMLAQQLRDPLTGQVLDFTSLDITIPHYVKRGDEILEITQIDDRLFFASSVRSVTIEDGIRGIGTEAFSGCQNLCSVHLPETLQELGETVFSLSSITELEIPSSVKKTGRGITDVCLYLRKITVHQKEEESPFNGYEWNTFADTAVIFTG